MSDREPWWANDPDIAAVRRAVFDELEGATPWRAPTFAMRMRFRRLVRLDSHGARSAEYSASRSSSCTAASPEKLLRRQALGVVDAADDPALQLTFGLDAVERHAQPASGFAPGHHHRFDVVAGQQLLRLLRGYPDHQPAMAACGHRHVAVDQECQPTEQPLLLDAAFGGNALADAVGQVLVVGHGSTLSLASDIRRPTQLGPELFGHIGDDLEVVVFAERERQRERDLVGALKAGMRVQCVG